MSNVQSLKFKQLPSSIAPDCCKQQQQRIEAAFDVQSNRSHEFDCPGCLRRWQKQDDGSWAIVNT